jgi:hypothetical protein
MYFEEHAQFEDLKIWGKVQVLKKNNNLFISNEEETPLLLDEPVLLKNFYFSSNSLQIFDGKHLMQFKIK